MANAEHIEWLLEGVESWNARREQTSFIPDLEGEDLYMLFQRENKLNEEQCIPLSGINLSEANLRGSRLSDRFRALGADLRKANLRRADLEKAKMANSQLEGADLVRATLTGANLHSAQPWKAKLYEEPHNSSEVNQTPVAENCIGCVSDLIDECTKIQSRFRDSVLYFRGECRIEGERGKAWKLEPSLMRNVGLRANERKMLLDLMSRRPEDFAHAQSALSQWVVAQHHGLKTRLLDISKNPLVALFNVCEEFGTTGLLHVFSVPRIMIKPFSSDTVRVIANFAKLSHVEQNVILGMKNWPKEWERDPQEIRTYSHIMQRLYDLIWQEKPGFQEIIDPRDFYRVFVVEPQQFFARIRAQSGAFLISAFHERFEREQILRWNTGIPAYGHFVLKVKKESKARIFEELELLNITGESLYPGLDEAAKSVTNAYSD